MISAFHALRGFRWGAMRFVALVVVPWMVAGCSGKQTIEGTATLDDRPLEQGYITFRPMPGAKGPPVGGSIEKGKYAIRSTDPLEGNFRVEITALGKTGKTVADGTGARIEIEGQVLPSRYNAESVLQAEVKARQRNEFPFSLKSK